MIPITNICLWESNPGVSFAMVNLLLKTSSLPLSSGEKLVTAAAALTKSGSYALGMVGNDEGM